MFLMKILAIEKEFAGKTAEDFKPHLEAEARKVWELYKKGVIREIYFPLVQEDLIYFDFIPLAPYPGFERLFKAK
jgi:hypothetical protein